MKKSYKALLIVEIEKESENQIMRDLNRTFPKDDYFKEGSKGV